MKKILSCILTLALAYSANAQSTITDRAFEEIAPKLPSPNVYRNGAGAPGHKYYQQQADYLIKASLDDNRQRIDASETITYTNNSPDKLTYLWVQLDQNLRKYDSDEYVTATSQISEQMSGSRLFFIVGHDEDYGYHITSVKDANGTGLKYTINKTMMRIDLPKELLPGEDISFSIDWWNNINNRTKDRARGGYEHFEEEDNYIYTMTSWFPRMCVYDDVNGWQNKPFLGTGEYTLAFGDYEVHITTPSDHMIAATGMLQNPESVLSPKEYSRFIEAKKSDKPLFIRTPEEANKIVKSKSKETKTWIYKAKNVRDFAWGSSRKFMWDAMGVPMNDGDTVLAMSYYPQEARGLYEKYSTKTIAHTLKTYSKYTIPYPYPVAISVEANNGMEYPMICFNNGRTEKDGTYPESRKYGVHSIIIHEVGHNYFPMIINSDERKWAWMDEGFNTFLQFVAEQELMEGYPSRRGPAHKITQYMASDPASLSPIMTQSDNVKQYFNNAYGKAATALVILRETVMGRELFDFAFKTYAQRWAFKHPMPEDFFRTMEDASGMDLDWFWNGWFYGIDPVDLSIKNVQWFKADSDSPQTKNNKRRDEFQKGLINKTSQQNKEENLKTAYDKDPDLNDFYNSYDRFQTSPADTKAYKTFVASLTEDEKKYFDPTMNYYEVEFENVGGLPMPIILKLIYADNSEEIVKIPAQIWRHNNSSVTKVFARNKEIVQLILDPNLETADIDEKNNYYPRQIIPSKFELYKRKANSRSNPMQSNK